MNFFKVISQHFESEAKREERQLRESKEKAITRFYSSMTKGVTVQTFSKVFEQYKEAGFQVLPEHNNFTKGYDPFAFLVSQVSSSMAEKIWTEMVPQDYKLWHQNNQYILSKTFWKIRSALKNVDVMSVDGCNNHILSHIPNGESAKFLIKHVFRHRSIDNIESYQNIFQQSLKYFSGYPTLYSEVNDILKQMINFTQNTTLAYEQEELNLYFKNDKRTKEQKTILGQIEQLRLYEKELSHSPLIKTKLTEILDYSTHLISNKRFSTLLEKKFELERLLTRHLPEVLSDYNDLPPSMRNSLIESIEKTPFNLVEETLAEIEKTIKNVGEEVFEKNLKNLSVKNRLMKR